MTKKIRVTEERFCCQLQDLMPYAGLPLPDFEQSVVFCKHCGQLHATESYMDAAGSRDWEYMKVGIVNWEFRA